MGNAGGQRPQQPNFRISVSTDGGAPPKNPHFLRHPNPLPNFPEWERILCNPNPPETVRIPSFISIFFENFEIHHCHSIYPSIWRNKKNFQPASQQLDRHQHTNPSPSSTSLLSSFFHHLRLSIILFRHLTTS